jgi:phospholipid transport system substrate-binding protein
VRKILALGLAALLGVGGGSASAQLLQPPPQRPDALMKAVTSEVIAVLKQDLAAGRPTNVAQLVEGKILPLFDFRRMTSIAMARNWRLASPEQQEALVTHFSTLLVRTYSTALSGYRDQEIEYRPLRGGPSETEVLVRSFLRRPGVEPLTIDYDMADSAAGWKVYDIKIAGISLVMNYRETFAAAVRSGGIEGLIQSLSDKNRENEVEARRSDAARLASFLVIYSRALRGPTQ